MSAPSKKPLSREIRPAAEQLPALAEQMRDIAAVLSDSDDQLDAIEPRLTLCIYAMEAKEVLDAVRRHTVCDPAFEQRLREATPVFNGPDSNGMLASAVAATLNGISTDLYFLREALRQLNRRSNECLS